MARTTDRETIILGIDPGTVVFGYGAIRVTNGKTIEILGMGAVQLKKLETHQLRLARIFERVTWLLETFTPDICAIEAPFYGKNVQSMLKLGRAQGVSMAAALNRDVPVVEYSPSRIKQSITGNGRSSKEQVAAMLRTVCSFDQTPSHLDATDALAVAVCHHFQDGRPSTTGGRGGGWKQFLKDNPGRVSGG